MLNIFPFLAVLGAFLGFLAGIGVGGGTLLILWLTLIMNVPHNVARSINLIFFLPTAVISSFFRWKQGALEIKTVLPAIIGGCISAALFSLLSQNMDITILEKLFGGLLLIAGVRELFYKPKKR